MQLRPEFWLVIGLAFSASPASAATTTLVQYDYEHDARSCPFHMCIVDAGQYAGIGEAITTPPKAQDVCGVRFKLARAGSPGRLLYALGRTRGGSDIASGSVATEDVVPLYDLLYGGDFPPQKVTAGETIYLTLRAEHGAYPEDYYLAYGPRPGRGTPEQSKGEALAPPGHKPMPLSHRLLTSVGRGDPPRGEERFEFVRTITAPAYAEAKRVRDPGRKPRPNEVALDDTWTIVAPVESSQVVETAVGDLKTFLDRAMGVHVAVEHADFAGEVLTRKRVILIGDRSALPAIANGVEGTGSYRVRVEPERVLLCGADDRGAMRAVYYLEDKMNFALGPYVERGDVIRMCLFTPRITQRVGPYNSFLTELSQPTIYTDGFLSRISHQGFSALNVYGNLEELTKDSEVFPELNDVRISRQSGQEIFPEVLDGRAAARRYERLRDLVTRAKRFGIDVYLYYATNYHHPVPEWFYEKHPDCRGFSWGNSMCTSSPEVLRYLEETTRHVFQGVPGLKGLVIIFDSEGFFSDAVGGRARCPRCRNRKPEDIVAEYLTVIDKAMKEATPQTELIAWSYFTGHPQWVTRAIAKLPKDVTLQAEFSKGAIIQREGVRHVAGDYQITEVGPAPHFTVQVEAAGAAGLKLSAKTEHSYSNEFVSVPYIPAPLQYYKRVAAFRQYPIRAVFANWTHYGYAPNPNAEILKWYSWDHAPKIEDLLADMARSRFGAKAAPEFVRAWHHFSKAITCYPYSDAVARNPGPIQVGPGLPLYLDGAKKLPSTWRSPVNDLSGTAPWGPEVALKSFGRLEAEWQAGVDLMSRAMAEVPTAQRSEAERELGIAKAILCCTRSYMNLTRFVVVRGELDAAKGEPLRSEVLGRMRTVALAELENAREALKVCEADSRVGYASGGSHVGGLYTPALIRWKIAQVETMLRAETTR
jgi:hypothetical protein